MSGLSGAGFERKRQVEIKEDIETALKLAFGDNIDLQAQSGFGQFVGIMSEALSDQWEQLENVYNSQYPTTASGVGLSNIVKLNGLTRIAEEFSVVIGVISGIPGTVVEIGSIAKTSDTSAEFATDNEVTIPAGGSINVGLTCTTPGSIYADAGTLTVIGSSVYGWTGITNAADATLGRDEETDAELRDRQDETTLSAGQNNSDSLYGQLLNLPGVIDAFVLDNKTHITDPNGIPPHSFEAIIQSGAEAEILAVIWNNTVQGINSSGDSSGFITDSQGFLQEVFYTRPTGIEYYVKMNITVNTSLFPVNGAEDIKEDIVEYSIENFGISDDVIYSQLFTPINQTPGIITIDLTIGLSSSPTGTINIPIEISEISEAAITRVEVNIV